MTTIHHGTADGFAAHRATGGEPCGECVTARLVENARESREWLAKRLEQRASFHSLLEIIPEDVRATFVSGLTSIHEDYEDECSARNESLYCCVDFILEGPLP